MALRVFSFYFKISILVAVILRFLEGGSKQNWEHEKKICPPFMYISLPPGTGIMCTIFPERKLGQLPCFSMALPKKGPVF
jgi:hypothetical protein